MPAQRISNGHGPGNGNVDFENLGDDFKVHALVGSSNEAQAENARKVTLRLLQQHNLTWNDLGARALESERQARVRADYEAELRQREADAAAAREAQKRQEREEWARRGAKIAARWAMQERRHPPEWIDDDILIVWGSCPGCLRE